MSYPDRRIKPVILFMVSSGIRVGAWDYVKWKHIEPLIREEKIVAAKLTVYAGTKDEYMTFITGEAYRAIKEWMDFRGSLRGEGYTRIMGHAR